MFSNILVPTDGSPASNVVLPLARTVATATGASITLMRVLRLEDHTPSREAFVAAQNSLRQLQVSCAQALLGSILWWRVHTTWRRRSSDRAARVLARTAVPLVLLRPGGSLALHAAVQLARTRELALRRSNSTHRQPPEPSEDSREATEHHGR